MKLSGVILAISMESANTTATSENLDTMNLSNTQDGLKSSTFSEQKKTVEVLSKRFKLDSSNLI